MTKTKKSAFSNLLDAAKGDISDVDGQNNSEVRSQPKAEVISSKKSGGKRSDPRYRQTSIYIRNDVHKKLIRHLEDSEYPGDFSDWIQEQMESAIAKPKGK
jgi:hypothetical protein